MTQSYQPSRQRKPAYGGQVREEWTVERALTSANDVQASPAKRRSAITALIGFARNQQDSKERAPVVTALATAAAAGRMTREHREAIQKDPALARLVFKD